MNKHIIFLFLLSVLLNACSRKKGTFLSQNDHFETVELAFEYMSAKAKFKFNDAKRKITGTANFRIKKDSIIWISISGFGIEVARILIDTSNIYVLDRLNKCHYEYTFEHLSQKYAFNFNFQMLQSIMLGNLIVPYKKEKIQKTENYFIYTALKDAYSFRNFIGLRTMKLEKMQVVGDNTENAISVNFNKFMMVGTQIFPNQISAILDYGSNNESNIEISISYHKMEMESSPISFPYSVSDKYEKK